MEALKEHTIPFTGLKDGLHEFQYELAQEFFEAAGVEDFEGGRVAVTVKLDKSTTMLIANIHVEGPVAVRCDHCNAPLDLEVAGDQRQIYQLNAEEAFDDEELVGLDVRAHSVNLTHYIYECLRLALPARKLHATGECDPEVEAVLDRLAVDQEPEPDPRWDALKDLKNPDNIG